MKIDNKEGLLLSTGNYGICYTTTEPLTVLGGGRREGRITEEGLGGEGEQVLEENGGESKSRGGRIEGMVKEEEQRKGEEGRGGGERKGRRRG